MLPKTHVILGAIFSILLYFFLDISLFNCTLVFLASVFIDVDHYLWFVSRKKSFDLKKAFLFHKNLPYGHKPMMHIFHTLEFLFFTLILSFVWNPFLFIFIGIVFHSIFDLIDMAKAGFIGRGFSLIIYLFSDNKKYL